MFYSNKIGVHKKMPFRIIGIRDTSPASECFKRIQACRLLIEIGEIPSWAPTYFRNVLEQFKTNDEIGEIPSWAPTYFRNILEQFKTNDIDALFKFHKDDEILQEMREFQIARTDSTCFEIDLKDISNIPNDTIRLKIQDI